MIFAEGDSLIAIATEDKQLVIRGLGDGWRPKGIAVHSRNDYEYGSSSLPDGYSNVVSSNGKRILKTDQLSFYRVEENDNVVGNWSFYGSPAKFRV